MTDRRASTARGPDGSGLRVLVPAYNEAENIGDVVRGILKWANAVLVVDDGSVDQTSAKAEVAGAMLLQHLENLGKGAAIWNGLCQLFSDDGNESNWIAIMDADGQHDPQDLAALVDCAKRDPDLRLVVGSRMSDPGSMPIIRYWTNRFTSYRISKLAGQSIPDSQCGYRLIHRDILNVWRPTVFHFDSETEMLIRASRGGLKIGCAQVRTLYPDGMRPSRIRPVRDTLRYFRMMHRLKQEGPDMHRDGNS